MRLGKRTKIYLICMLLLGATPLLWKGLQFGMDFTGGTLIEIKLDIRPGEAFDMQTVVTVLQNRLNTYGLKDVAVKPWGINYIVVEIAETDPEAVNQLQSLLGQQGKFETLFEGRIVLTGEDIISVIMDPQKGYGVRQVEDLYEWSAPFLLTSQAANRFASAIEGMCTPVPGSSSCAEVVYMFIDRPEDAVILMDPLLHDRESAIPEDLDSSPNTIPIGTLVENSGVELVISTSSLSNNTLERLRNKTVIIAEDSSFSIAILESYAYRVVEKPQISKFWVADALNLENIVHLTPGITIGRPITQPSITGRASDVGEATAELNRVAILLKSGKLPVSVSVGSISTISPTLGGGFLNYSAIAGFAAIIAVAGVIFVRYKKIKITLSIMVTLVSEVFMILGVAALIGWQLDLPSVAGIVTAVGTGVDDQIIIVDEVLRKEEERILSIASKIKKAFSIIFMAAATIIFAMAPLLFMGLGILKGFAITTIIGVFVGIFITRPAFAEWVDKLLK